ncbi:hypothetical protein COMA2_30262 [Candidatus Nitrospira nitrificans]|uniref:Uncharacterized protein n=1 Tax=Candidatus Nitrospira nitrificans TaxID=1742973 RepID=A0A0S4LLM0_9BACT|nr:hypothetical protein COMA2_30262 [Candidatus Nitrospira nitrificans]
MTSSIVDLLEANAEKTRENVDLMGYEELTRWMLMEWVLLRRWLHAATQRPVSTVQLIRQKAVGRGGHLPSIPVSIADPLQCLVSGNRRLRKGRQRSVPSMVSYPHDLFRFQSR